MTAPLITICMFCHRRKVDDETWVEWPTYPPGPDDPKWRALPVSHGLCPECNAREYGEDEQPPTTGDKEEQDQ